MQGSKLMFSEDDRKAVVAKARKRDKALADKLKAKAKPKAKKAAVPATKVVATRKTTEALLEEVVEVKNTNDREQEIIAAEVKDLQVKGLLETTVRELNEMRHGKPKPEKIIAVRHLNNAKDLSLVESDFKMIVQIQESFRRNVETALMQAAQMGGLLFRIKSLLKFGEFQKWCRKTLPFTVRTAEKYMLLHHHYPELLRQGVSSISGGYAAINGEASPIEHVDTDDNIDYPKPAVKATVNLDNLKLPKKRAKGPWRDLHIDKETISKMATWGNASCVKIIVKIPINKEAEKLMGEFVVAAQRVLEPGGKLILHLPAKEVYQ